MMLERIALSLAWSLLTLVAAHAQCRLGDHLIGEDDNAYYCSTRTCAQLSTQVRRDQDALDRLRKNMLSTNAELRDWTVRNNKAAESAFHRSVLLLHDATLGALEHLSQGQVDAIKTELRRRPPTGTTWRRLLERTADLEHRRARLSALADAFSLSQYPFSNLTTAYADLKIWAKDANREADGITRTVRAMNSDPEGRQILLENGASFAADSLKLALAPLVAQSLSLGEYFVNYGYDATAWLESRARIVQNIENQDKNRMAVCKLSAQLKSSVRENNICHGKYPAANEVPPDPGACK